MLLTLVVAIAGATAIAVVAGVAGVDITSGKTPPGIEIGGTFVQDLGLILSAVVFAKANAGKVVARDFGLRRTALWKAIGWMALVAFTFLAVSAVYAAAVNAPETSNQADDLGAGDSTLNLVVVAVLVCVVAPISEEFFFRAFFYRALRTRLPVWAAAPIDGIVFGALHFEGADTAIILPVIAVFGIGQCLVYERTGSLFAVIAIHASFNTVASLGTAPVPALAIGALVVSGCLLAPRRFPAAPAAIRA
jgi:membrane protease YdiL (CAAX protease family)